MTKQIPGQESMIFDYDEPVVPGAIKNESDGEFDSETEQKIDHWVDDQGIPRDIAIRWATGRAACSACTDMEGYDSDDHIADFEAYEEQKRPWFTKLDINSMPDAQKDETKQQIWDEFADCHSFNQRYITDVMETLWKLDHGGDDIPSDERDSYAGTVCIGWLKARNQLQKNQRNHKKTD